MHPATCCNERNQLPPTTTANHTRPMTKFRKLNSESTQNTKLSKLTRRTQQENNQPTHMPAFTHAKLQESRPHKDRISAEQPRCCATRKQENETRYVNCIWSTSKRTHSNNALTSKCKQLQGSWWTPLGPPHLHVGQNRGATKSALQVAKLDVIITCP